MKSKRNVNTVSLAKDIALIKLLKLLHYHKLQSIDGQCYGLIGILFNPENHNQTIILWY